MGGIFNRIRSGAGRATFEADKQRRILAIQATVRGLRREIEQSVQRVGGVAMGLYHAGRLAEPELQQVCQETAALQAQVAAQEREIESIRQETFVEPTYGPTAGAGAAYGDVCPNGHGALPAGARFCPVCGAQAVYRAPPAAGTFCPSCGAALVPGASFCPSCGAPQQAVAPQAPPPPEASAPLPPQPPAGARVCSNCGTVLPAEATFCGQCGQPVAAPTTVEEAPAATEIEPAAVLEPIATEPEPMATEIESKLSMEEAAFEPEPKAPEDEAFLGVAPSDSLNRCSACGTPLVPEAAFCPECGQVVARAEEAVAPPASSMDDESPLQDVVEEPLAVAEATDAVEHCPNCGAALVPEAMFCPDCGQPRGESVVDDLGDSAQEDG